MVDLDDCFKNSFLLEVGWLSGLDPRLEIRFS